MRPRFLKLEHQRQWGRYSFQNVRDIVLKTTFAPVWASIPDKFHFRWCYIGLHATDNVNILCKN